MTTPEDDQGNDVGDFGQLVQTIKKGRSQVRISISEFNGKKNIDIRTFYIPKGSDDDLYKPTRRGVTIPTDSYWDFFNGVIDVGNTLGLLDDESIAKLKGTSIPQFGRDDDL